MLAAGDTVEKVHQATWYVLLLHSELLAELGVVMASRSVTATAAIAWW